LEFLQAYGFWIVAGLFFVLMMRGGGCGMGHQNSSDEPSEHVHGSTAEPTDGTPRSSAPAQRSGGCH
jgi:hypothetical protein